MVIVLVPLVKIWLTISVVFNFINIIVIALYYTEKILAKQNNYENLFDYPIFRYLHLFYLSKNNFAKFR